MKGFCICIAKDCAAKRALGVGGLADKVFQAKKVEALATEWKEKDPNRTAEQIFIKTTVRDRDGTSRERDVSISEARMQFYDLQGFLSECTSCDANVASDRFAGGVFSGFGCYMSVGYPIKKELEDALVLGAKRAIQVSKIEPSVAFLDRIVKEKVTGNFIADLRNEKPPGIVSKAPQTITYGGFLSKKTITSDMLLEMFLSGEANPEDAFLFHHFCENIHTALQDAGADYDIRDFITELSSLYGTAADNKRSVSVSKG